MLSFFIGSLRLPFLEIEIIARDNLADDENRRSVRVIRACDIAPLAWHIASQ
jgi:hypothetical protein